MKKIKTALISVFHKDGLDQILDKLNEQNVRILSTGGTYDFIKSRNIEVEKVEDLTGYPSILGGRVKTLHPSVFGGILGRRDDEGHIEEMGNYNIPEIDLVIVDLYPFEDTVRKTSNMQEIIEKIDIGGISLIRAAAKNFRDVLIIPSKGQYDFLLDILSNKDGQTELAERHFMAAHAFNVSSSYDTAIFEYFNKDAGLEIFKVMSTSPTPLRYGENPHQKGVFYGKMHEMFDQLHGKAISYNNLLDIDAAVALISEFDETTFAILKHNTACGLASRENLVDAWKDALAADPVSAFGGVLIANEPIDLETAEEINKIFFEVIIAPHYNEDALEVLKTKKNRIILKLKTLPAHPYQFKTVLNGILVQDKDNKTEKAEDLTPATKVAPDQALIEDLLFANKIVKHTKSNAIVLAKNKMLLGSGTGQTSRVDALKQAIKKAESFELSLENAVLASDAFFPFNDNVEIAYNAGIRSVIQPGGSVRDQDSIDFCDEKGMAMVFTGTRHFKH